MGEVGKHIGRNDERAAADSEKPRENACDESGDNDQSREQYELAHRHTQDHVMLRRQRRMDQAAAPCTIRASISTTRASASRNAAAPAAGFDASVARWRRKARAPGTARNRTRTCRATALSRVPRA